MLHRVDPPFLSKSFTLLWSSGWKRSSWCSQRWFFRPGFPRSYPLRFWSSARADKQASSNPLWWLTQLRNVLLAFRTEPRASQMSRTSLEGPWRARIKGKPCREFVSRTVAREEGWRLLSSWKMETFFIFLWHKHIPALHGCYF